MANVASATTEGKHQRENSFVYEAFAMQEAIRRVARAKVLRITAADLPVLDAYTRSMTKGHPGVGMRPGVARVAELSLRSHEGARLGTKRQVTNGALVLERPASRGRFANVYRFAEPIMREYAQVIADSDSRRCFEARQPTPKVATVNPQDRVSEPPTTFGVQPPTMLVPSVQEHRKKIHSPQPPTGARECASRNEQPKADAVTVFPFGESKDLPMTEVPDKDLLWLRDDARRATKAQRLAADAELKRRLKSDDEKRLRKEQTLRDKRRREDEEREREDAVHDPERAGVCLRRDDEDVHAWRRRADEVMRERRCPRLPGESFFDWIGRDCHLRQQAQQRATA